MNTIKKVFKYITTVLSYSALVLLIAIGIIFILYVVDVKVQQSKGGTAKPLFGAYVIISGSMEPNIHVYDVIISKRVDPSTLKKGDVITFHSNDTRFYGETVTHRIIEEVDSKKGIYRTQGDANNVADDALTVGENILGKVVMKIPQLGRVQSFIASKGGWLIVILIPCLCVISYDILKIIKLVSKKGNKDNKKIENKDNDKNNNKKIKQKNKQ